jgi:hypothetical protein
MGIRRRLLARIVPGPRQLELLLLGVFMIRDLRFALVP